MPRALLLLLVLTGCTGPTPGPAVPTALRLERWEAAATSSAAPAQDARSTDAAPARLVPAAAAAPAASRAQASGGGTPAAAPAPITLAGQVLDEAGLPLEGAVAWLSTGASAPTDEAGRFTLPGFRPGGTVGVSKDGYAVSIVLGLTGEATFHLRRMDGRSAAFDQRPMTVAGRVEPPAGGMRGGVAYYQDTRSSSANPVPIAGDGSFSFTVTPIGPGDPVGVVLVLASDAEGRQLMGLSPAFSPAEDAPAPIPLHAADHAYPFAVSAAPAGLDRLESRLEIQAAGGPTVVLDGVAAARGALMAPAPGALPGAMRLAIEARSADGRQSSLIAREAGTGVLEGAFLAVPEVVIAAPGQPRWQQVPGATGYRAETRADGALGPLWEAWCAVPTAFTLVAEEWPRAGVLRVEAVDAPGLAARHVAALRALRIAPWQERPAYRHSSRTVAIE